MRFTGEKNIKREELKEYASNGVATIENNNHMIKFRVIKREDKEKHDWFVNDYFDYNPKSNQLLYIEDYRMRYDYIAISEMIETVIELFGNEMDIGMRCAAYGIDVVNYLISLDEVNSNRETANNFAWREIGKQVDFLTENFSFIDEGHTYQFETSNPVIRYKLED